MRGADPPPPPAASSSRAERGLLVSAAILSRHTPEFTTSLTSPPSTCLSHRAHSLPCIIVSCQPEPRWMESQSSLVTFDEQSRMYRSRWTISGILTPFYDSCEPSSPQPERLASPWIRFHGGKASQWTVWCQSTTWTSRGIMDADNANTRRCLAVAFER